MSVFSDPKLVYAILATVISIGAFFPYLWDVLKLKTKPHLYTWAIWCITQGTAVTGLWYGNGGWGAIALTIGTGFVLLITLLSLKYGTKNITRSDTVVLILALLAVLVWWQLKNPVLAVLMVSAIDMFGYIPSWRKSVTEPWSETVWTWLTFCVANVFAILALTEYNTLTVTYLLTITTANLILVGICLYFRRTVPKPIT